MPRKRPSRLRAEIAQPLTVAIPGVPYATSVALDRLARPEISSAEVRWALTQWQELVSRSPVQLGTSDLADFIGPDARRTLDRALNALSRPNAAALRRVVEPVDERFLSKTRPNPMFDPSLPWWERRATD